MKELKVIKANKVVEAGYELTTNEQRLILAVISKIPAKTAIEPTVGYEITAQEFADIYNIHPKTAYRELQEAVSKLYERSINLRTDTDTIKLRWTSMVMFSIKNVLLEALGHKLDDAQKRVVIHFSPQIIPYLSNLKANFTQYLLSDIANITGTYTIRFYELIKQYQSIGKREISIKDLRFMLNLNDKYPMFSDLRRWVIEPSIKEINEKTPLNVKYELNKSGKKISHIILTFSEKKKENSVKMLEQRDPNTIDWVNGTTDNENKLKLLTQKQADYFSSKLANDSNFGSKFAGSGESMQAFTSRISSELQRDISKVILYMPYLVAQGYQGYGKSTKTD